MGQKENAPGVECECSSYMLNYWCGKANPRVVSVQHVCTPGSQGKPARDKSKAVLSLCPPCWLRNTFLCESCLLRVLPSLEAYLAGKGDLCIVGVAQQLGLLLPQHQRLLDEGRVVGLPRGRARDEGPVQLLPQRPAIRQLTGVSAVPCALSIAKGGFITTCRENSAKRRLVQHKLSGELSLAAGLTACSTVRSAFKPAAKATSLEPKVARTHG